MTVTYPPFMLRKARLVSYVLAFFPTHAHLSKNLRQCWEEGVTRQNIVAVLHNNSSHFGEHKQHRVTV